MNWLKAIVEGFFNSLFRWGQSQAEKPKTHEDANTPKSVRDDLNNAVDEFMRDKDNRRD